MKFNDLRLGPDVLRAVADAGYTEPTPIQEQAIPHILAARDIIGMAQTGTGKTAGFTLPMIDILSSGRARARMPRSLILEPTRELAAQVAENFETYGKYSKLSMALLIGGVSFGDQDQKLTRGVDVLVATPGRLLDHFGRGKILLADIKVFVIDEADRMLDMGFIPDVERIIKLLPRQRQTLMFSATMPAEIRRLASAYLDSPQEVAVARSATAVENVQQSLVMVAGDFKAKRAALRNLLRGEDVKNAIIFCNRKRDVTILDRSLRRHGFNAAALHGDMDQIQRMATLDSFRKGEVTLLVASDVAARGLDIVNMSHVFNFDVPIHAEDYIHRIGRTARAGRAGSAVTLATPAESKAVGAIQKLIGSEIQRIEVPRMDPPRPVRREEKAPSRREERPRSPRNGRVSQRSGDDSAVRPAASRQRPKPDKALPVEKVVGMGDHVPAFLLR